MSATRKPTRSVIIFNNGLTPLTITNAVGQYS